MKPPAKGRPGEGGNPLAGLLLLARGKAAGLGFFGATPNAFLASLAPLIAFPLVGTGLLLAAGKGADAVADFLAVICALLSPAVLSHVLARLWGREAEWLRFATAFNWCQWIIPVLFMLLLFVFGIALHLGLSERLAGAGTLGAVGAYALWLQWFLARHGLVLSGWRAAGMVAWVNLGTAVVLLVPTLVMLAVERGS